MHIQFKHDLAGKNPEEQATIIFEDCFNVIRQFMELYYAIQDEGINAYFEANGDPDIGELPEELMLENANDILSGVDFERIDKINESGYIGMGYSTLKYRQSIIQLGSMTDTIRYRARQNLVYTDAELKELRANVAASLGDLLYAFSCMLFNPVNAKWITCNPDEPLQCDQVIDKFIRSKFSESKDPIRTFALFISLCQDEFTSLVPLCDSDPITWSELTENLSPDLVDGLRECELYITSLDVRAIKRGYIAIDENYLDTLQARKDNPEYPGNESPRKWAKFLSLIPDESIPDFYELESYLTIDIIQAPLAEEKVTSSFFDWIRQTFKVGEVNDRAERSTVFK